MNREKFLQKVSKLGTGMEVDAHRMPKWFEESLKALEAFGKQKEGVKHPGHRGASRENPLQGLLDRMLPATVSVEKGFAVNRWMAESKEQDLLVVDGNISGRLFPEEDYFPIESCLASIQVKSNLTRAEIRKATVNCASIKRLFGWPLVEEEKSDDAYDTLCYIVFSYGSNLGLERLAQVVNEEMEGVRRHFWPNAFYVLGKGMLIPGDDHRVPLDSRTMFTGSKFRTVAGFNVPGVGESEAHSFLWFLSNIIDHCFTQRGERKSPSYKSYWFATIGAQLALNRELAKDDP